MDAERVIVELLAKVDNFDGTVKQSATTFESSMDKIEKSAEKAEQAVTKGSKKQTKSLDDAGKSTTQFVRKISEASTIVSSNKSPFVVIPKQAPAVGNAMRLVSTGAGLLGGVLGGALAAGALTAVAALATLIFKNEDAAESIDELIEKLKKNAAETAANEQAQLAFANTIEGVTEAVRENEKALDALDDAHKTGARQALESAVAARARLEIIRAETLALIENARARLEVTRATSIGTGETPEIAAFGVSAAISNLDKLEKALTKVDAITVKVDEHIQRALSHRVVELATASDIEKVNQKYDAQINTARKAALASGTVETALRREITAIEAAREAELKRLKDIEAARRQADRDNRQSGRQISEAEARAIVASIGGTVTSGTRTPAQNRAVDGAANSFHLKGQAIDIAKTAGLTLGKIVKAFEKAGVSLIEKLDEGDHFHIAFARRSAGGRRGPSDETLAKRALAEAQAELRRQQAYENELASLREDEIQARQALITSAEEIAKLELQAIEVARTKYNDNLDSLVEQKKLLSEEATELRKINDERAKLRAELVQRREDERKFRMQEAAAQRQLEASVGSIGVEQELLQSQERLATTAKERGDIERRLLDLQFQEERLALEAAIARAARLKAEYERTKSQETLALLEQAEVDAAIARQRLGTIDERQGNAQAGADRDNASPLTAFFQDIPNTAAEIDEAFESIAAGGLATFTDALTDAIVNFRSLGDVGRAVLQDLTAALVRMAIQQIILRTIGQTSGQAAVAQTTVQAGQTAAAWAPAAAAASLATAGGNSAGAIAAIAAVAALAAGLFIGSKLKDGGRVYGPGTSTSDSVPIMGSKDEFMLRAAAARSIGYDNLAFMNRTGRLPQGYEGGGAIKAPNLGQMNMRAVPGGRGGNSELSERSVAKLRQIVSDSINAMPDVKLYPTVDSGDTFRRGLRTTAGSREMQAWLSDNAGAVKATLSRP